MVEIGEIRTSVVDYDVIPWDEILEYKEVEGEARLIWKINASSLAPIGSFAGCLKHTGYFEVGFKGVQYRRSRIVYTMMIGKIPIGNQVDHINRIKWDDRYSNLRAITGAQNMTNRATNAAGRTGVHFNNGATGKNKWRAHITVNKQKISLGHYATVEEAIEARIKAEIHYGVFITKG